MVCNGTPSQARGLHYSPLKSVNSRRMNEAAQSAGRALGGHGTCRRRCGACHGRRHRARGGRGTRMTSREQAMATAAEAYVRGLAERGIDYLFANAGTDCPPIIEALQRAAEEGTPAPRTLAVPHENLAIAMAYGHAMVSRRPQAVMLHVNVGTANAICGLLNAARERIPMVVAAGRTPYSEAGHLGSRSLFIHWAQEMFDQAAMLREIVKWDYELRLPDQVGPALDRALALAMSEPRGPVYLTLPRELLADPAVSPRRDTVRPLGASAPVPSLAAIEQAAAILAAAEFPLILTASAGRTTEAMTALATLAQDFALPVVQSEARDISLPTDHPMCLGFDPGPLLGKADAIAVFDSAVPWIPRSHPLKRDAKVICFGPDPLFSRYPFREFEADLLVTGESGATFAMLREALAQAMRGRSAAVESRRKLLAEMRSAMNEKRRATVEKVKSEAPIHPLYLTHCLNELKAKDAIIVNELGIPVGGLDLTAPQSFIGNSLAGGLGSGLGC
ncbi:MAG: thiamine pyrophosphate-requiring protein, partial [Alphaproteobacteria bacterium]